MNRFAPTPAFSHDQRPRTAVLLVQLGTPDAPTAAAVRPYLRQFLSDPRVVEIPPFVWWPILNGVILTTRPRKSARKYASVWTPEGSPLRVYSERQATMLRGWLGERGHDVEVALAMRYGEPSIPSVLEDLRRRNVTRLLVLPLYPQYASSTTATAFDEVNDVLRRWRNLPEVRWVRSFHDDDRYLDALVATVTRAWEDIGPPDKLVMSFHGLPRRTLELGDPYHCECHATGRLLMQRLGLRREDCIVTFQSRFGRAKWLQPYTEPTLRELGRSGVGRVDVVCPGFVSDCLETLEEISIEAKAAFLEAGGRDFRYIPCVNDSAPFIEALADLTERHMQGWPTARREAGATSDAEDAALAARKRRAMEMGASN
jgi:protoporphyrin/coproporphyrin ferrochelatase